MDLTTYALLSKQIHGINSFSEEDSAKLDQAIQDIEALSSQVVNKEEFADMLSSLVTANDNDKIDTIEEIANWITGEEADRQEIKDKLAELDSIFTKKEETEELSEKYDDLVARFNEYIENQPDSSSALPEATEDDVNKVLSIDSDGQYVLSQVSYNNLTNKPEIPTIPSNVSAFENDAGYLTEHQDISDKVDSSSLANVATTGSYEDLINKPSIPVVPSNISAFNNDAGYLTEHQDIAGKVDASALANVATSGDYADLSNVPTNVSAFNNDAGYLTQHQDISGKANVSDIPVVPSNVSAFDNDAGYLTEHQDVSDKASAADLSSHVSNTVMHITEAERTAWSAKANVGDIPTKVSDLTNDASYITLNDLPEALPEVTAANAGEFLRVSDLGTWVAAVVPSAESEEY